MTISDSQILIGMSLAGLIAVGSLGAVIYAIKHEDKWMNCQCERCQEEGS